MCTQDPLPFFDSVLCNSLWRVTCPVSPAKLVMVSQEEFSRTMNSCALGRSSVANTCAESLGLNLWYAFSAQTHRCLLRERLFIKLIIAYQSSVSNKTTKKSGLKALNHHWYWHQLQTPWSCNGSGTISINLVKVKALLILILRSLQYQKEVKLWTLSSSTSSGHRSLHVLYRRF